MPTGESISLKVVTEVADRDGIDPTELQPPLHTVVDTDALDALFRSPSGTTRAAGTVEFTYRGYAIRVDGSGDVTIRDAVSFTEQTEPRTQPDRETITD